MNKTPIEWTNYSVNPFKMRMPDGTLINVCVHKSNGCKNCYAEMIVRRWWKKSWGPFPGYTAALLKLGTPVLVEEELNAVLRLSERIAKGKADPEENKIFWNDMTDEALDFWPDSFLASVFQVRYDTKNLIHQVLTKRIDRMHGFISRSAYLCNAPLENVHLGVSVEDQKTADERIPLLLETPAAVRWISAEPLLGPIDLEATEAGDILNECECGEEGCELCGDKFGRLNWVVVGGESGPGARPMHPDWARSLRDQCVAAGVPFFFKQWGEYKPLGSVFKSSEVMFPLAAGIAEESKSIAVGLNGRTYWNGDDDPVPESDPDAYVVSRVGKKAAGRLIDGREWNEYPLSTQHSALSTSSPAEASA
jgi:protein gp37